jgi:hypothetical protein
LRLSPDGKSAACIAPTAGQGANLVTLEVAYGSPARNALRTSGKPERLGACTWVSNQRLVCTVYGITDSGLGSLPFTREIAVDRIDTTTMKSLPVERPLPDLDHCLEDASARAERLGKSDAFLREATGTP